MLKFDFLQQVPAQVHKYFIVKFGAKYKIIVLEFVKLLILTEQNIDSKPGKYKY